MDGKLMVRQIVFTILGLAFIAQTYGASDQGTLNKQKDSALFQHKCSACHTVGLISWGPDVLPTNIWKMVLRMAEYEGANIFCCSDKQRIYWYIVDYVAKSRAEELQQALDCLPEYYRQYEQECIEQAQDRYK